MGDFLGPPLGADETFFWWTQKKSPLILLPRSTPCQITWSPHAGASPARGEERRSYEGQRQCFDSTSPLAPGCLRPTFLGRTPKKSSSLSAPKKPNKCTETGQTQG